ncbi:MAG TPA: hypothetical protein VMO00_19625 [Methylomirabilota bacterium]|nr:hypothetical protein [Methylomirabilota bacterium]
MPTFRIWRIGSREACIEEANSAREACEKTGWEPEECELQIIPEENIVRERGVLSTFRFRVPEAVD